MRHRRGTPGLTPYRLRTIEAGYPRRRRPARHLRRGDAAKSAVKSAAQPVRPDAHDAAADLPRPGKAAAILAPRRRGASTRPGRVAARRGWITRREAGIRRRIAGSQLAMGVAGAITLALLIVGGYQAAAGAAVVLGMF